MEVEGPRRQSSSASSSPDFEFCMVSNPSYPPSGLLTADELFFDGVIVPLHLLSLQRSDPSAQPAPDPPVQFMPDRPSSDPPPSSTSASFTAAPTSGSRRWKDLFKVAGEKKPEEKDKERKKERKSSDAASGGSAELNINLNIWPFSRSHSAGNTSAAGSRPRSAAFRKVSSAPCSRSNSRGESAAAGGGRKSGPSPGRSGVHLSRSNPIWQLRRAGMGHKEKARKSSAAPTAGSSSSSGGVRVLNLNVNSCIGYRNQTSCRDDDGDGVTGGDRTIEGSGSNGSIFSLRALFSKKVY